MAVLEITAPAAAPVVLVAVVLVEIGTLRRLMEQMVLVAVAAAEVTIVAWDLMVVMVVMVLLSSDGQMVLLLSLIHI